MIVIKIFATKLCMYYSLHGETPDSHRFLQHVQPPGNKVSIIFEVITTLAVESSIFCDVTPSSPVNVTGLHVATCQNIVLFKCILD
jgi:hypothetical protein